MQCPIILLHAACQLLEQVLGFLQFFPPLLFVIMTFLLSRFLLLLLHFLEVKLTAPLFRTDHVVKIVVAVLGIEGYGCIPLFLLVVALSLVLFRILSHQLYNI
jgi:hypothetical protein